MLIPDWDVFNKIYHSLKQLQVKRKVWWIKGHQDKDKPFEALPHLAQLNVQSDWADGKYQSTHQCHQPIVPWLPHNPAQLFVSKETITSNYKQKICYALTAPALTQHMMFKYLQLDTRHFQLCQLGSPLVIHLAAYQGSHPHHQTHAQIATNKQDRVLVWQPSQTKMHAMWLSPGGLRSYFTLPSKPGMEAILFTNFMAKVL